MPSWVCDTSGCWTRWPWQVSGELRPSMVRTFPTWPGPTRRLALPRSGAMKGLSLACGGLKPDSDGFDRVLEIFYINIAIWRASLRGPVTTTIQQTIQPPFLVNLLGWGTLLAPHHFQEPLLDAISAEVCRRSTLQPRELANLAWCFATLRRCHGPLFAVLAAATAATLPSFQPLDLANAAGALAAAGAWPPMLQQAVAQRSVACLELGMESQPLVNLVDLDLPAPDGNYLLETLLRRVDAFHNEWIKEDAFSPSNGILLQWHIDNFGIHGTTYLLSKFGIEKPEKRFLETAEASTAAVQLGEDWRQERFFVKDRVSCYLEYRIGPDPAPLKGSFVKENRFHGEGTRAGRAGLLRSWVLPISGVVDRSLCAEFQALSELCDRLDAVQKEPQATLALEVLKGPGTVCLWTSGASCLSCVRAMRQFREIFPHLRLKVSFGPKGNDP
eukprot:s1276_g18.t1